MNSCLNCGKATKNKQFCKAECRKEFNMWSKECGHSRSPRLSMRGRRA